MNMFWPTTPRMYRNLTHDLSKYFSQVIDIIELVLFIEWLQLVGYHWKGSNFLKLELGGKIAMVA